MNVQTSDFLNFRYDRRCGIKYDIVYDSVNEKSCSRTYEEKCEGKGLRDILNFTLAHRGEIYPLGEMFTPSFTPGVNTLYCLEE
jgi:hypothetical protein